MNYLNYSEMVAVQNFAHDWLYEIEDAETLLRCAMDRFFGDAGGLDAEDALEVGTLLRVCCDRIRVAALNSRMAVGENAPGADKFFEAAADYRAARELDKLAGDAYSRERELSGPDHDAFAARRLAAYRLPPAAGIAALRELLGEDTQK